MKCTTFIDQVHLMVFMPLKYSTDQLNNADAALQLPQRAASLVYTGLPVHKHKAAGGL